MISEITIFDKILSEKIPSTKIYEDDLILAFKDVNPCAKVHVLLIPKYKQGLIGINYATSDHQELLGYMMISIPKIAEKCGLTDGYRLVINDGLHGCQAVNHLHIHIIGGEQLYWPPTGINKLQ